ncbi:MAG: beta-N-acetylhexosaminidase [Acidobacteria bacterium]|nr:MAG: beta-N-acetylhexosaminidase [Acidobacteriota bacterium]
MTRLSSKVLASAGLPCGVRPHRLEYGPMPKDGLSLEDKVGQLFWIGFRGTALEPPLRSLLERVRPGGLILFARNIESAPQVRSLNDALNGFLRIPPFIALDQEGGRVNRLRPILGPIPPNLALARRRAAARAVGQQAGAMVGALRSLGFSVNLAPVLDLSGPDPANGIGDRAFGEDPATVCRLARVFLETHLRAGVVPVGKHFPGLGAARADTHLTLPVILKSRARLTREDLVPYRRLRRQLPIVMAGHAYYSALQEEPPGPATLSRAVIEGLLRRRLGYRGLVVTDDLEMGAVEQEKGAAAQALAALAAGNDGLMFCGSEEKILEAYEGVLGAVLTGEVDERRVDRSLKRINALKARFLRPRRRARFSEKALERSRRALAALGAGQDSGSDPTARL